MAKSTYSAKDLNSLLPADTKELFQIVKLEKESSSRIVFHKFGEVDFKTLSIPSAEQLVKQGAEWIERVKSKAKGTESGEK